jgi:hypothetical protein
MVVSPMWLLWNRTYRCRPTQRNNKFIIISANINKQANERLFLLSYTHNKHK